MAKTKPDRELAKRLRAKGIRKRTADLIARVTDGRRKPARTRAKSRA